MVTKAKFVSQRIQTIKDTEKSKNIPVEVGCEVTLDEMETILTDATSNLGLVMSHINTLSRKKFRKQALAP